MSPRSVNESFLASIPETPAVANSFEARRETRHLYPGVNDPGIIRVACAKCGQRWSVSLPMIRARRFLLELSCECGATPKTDLLVDLGSHRSPDRLRRIVDVRDDWRVA